MRMWVFGMVCALGAAGCGGRSALVEFLPDGGGGGGGGDGGIPSPGTGNQVNVSFVSVEPNDTPAEATPLGIASSADLVIWVGSNTVGGSDDANYFVFESAPQAGQLEFNMCFTPPIATLTATLWKVEGGVARTPPIDSWPISQSCTSNFTAPLEASTTYLFGVLATGGAGTYTA